MKHKFKLGAKVYFKSSISHIWTKAIVVRFHDKFLPVAYQYMPTGYTGKYGVKEGNDPSAKIMRKWADDSMLKVRDET